MANRRDERNAVRLRDLSRPLIHSGDSGHGEFTILTGGNVALAPAFVTRVADGDAWGALRKTGDGLPLLVFARPPSHGLAGVVGRVAPCGDGHALLVEECFGRPSGLRELGSALGAYLSDARRFPVTPVLVIEGAGAGLDAFAEALAAHGVEARQPGSAPGR